MYLARFLSFMTKTMLFVLRARSLLSRVKTDVARMHVGPSSDRLYKFTFKKINI